MSDSRWYKQMSSRFRFPHQQMNLNPNVTWNIVQQRQDIFWSYDLLSANPNITWDIVQSNPDYEWDLNLLCTNRMDPYVYQHSLSTHRAHFVDKVLSQYMLHYFHPHHLPRIRYHGHALFL